MRIDLYTKTVLTLILVLLVVIGLKPAIYPPLANAQSSLGQLQFSVGGQGLFFFDSKTGELWAYEIGGNGIETLGKLVQPGKPLAKQ